jgi:hypothetical protein
MATSDTDSHVYGDGSEAFKLNEESVKEKAGFRAGRVEYKLLHWLAESGLRRFNLTEAARGIGEDVRRVYQSITYLIRRAILAREARGWYRVLVDPWELLKNVVIQGPNAQRVKEGVKENHGTRFVARVSVEYSGGVVGLFFDNVRGFDGGGRVPGDRGRVLGRGDLGRFSGISYAEVSVATGTSLFEGLGVLVVYYKCKGHGSRVVCSDWVEWRPPRGFYKKHSVVEAVGVFRSRVLPYAFGLVARAGVVAGAQVERLRSSLYGLARQLYLTIRPSSGNSNSSCRAPAVELGDDGGYTVCFKCPPVLYRRLINVSRVSGHSWNDIIVETLSGVLP